MKKKDKQQKQGRTGSKLGGFLKPGKLVLKVSIKGDAVDLDERWENCTPSQLVMIFGMLFSSMVSKIVGINVADHIQGQHMNTEKKGEADAG